VTPGAQHVVSHLNLCVSTVRLLLFLQTSEKVTLLESTLRAVWQQTPSKQ
jgi:hypothetical protein